VAPPVLLVLKLTAVVFDPLQTTWFAGSFTCAEGFTVMVNDSAGPVQFTPPFVKVGVMVMVAVTGDVPGLVATNALIFPEPLAFFIRRDVNDPARLKVYFFFYPGKVRIDSPCFPRHVQPLQEIEEGHYRYIAFY